MNENSLETFKDNLNNSTPITTKYADKISENLQETFTAVSARTKRTEDAISELLEKLLSTLTYYDNKKDIHPSILVELISRLSSTNELTLKTLKDLMSTTSDQNNGAVFNFIFGDNQSKNPGLESKGNNSKLLTSGSAPLKQISEVSELQEIIGTVVNEDKDIQ